MNLKQLTFFNACLCFLFLQVNTHAQDLNYAKAAVKTLTSADFKGRGYVANGAKKAAEFVAAEFKKDGLTPLNKGSYFHEFELSVNTFPGKIKLAVNGQLLEPAVDYLVNSFSPSVKGKFKVYPVTRAQLRSVQFFDALIAKAKDGFILLDNRPVAKETEEEDALVSKHIRSLKTDEKLDFKGFIVSSNDKLTWTTLTYQLSRPVLTINKKDFNPSTANEIDIDVEAKFIPAYKTRNVAGMVKGTSVPDSLVVVTAHFDHLGMMGNQIYFPGANDNASGTAMLLSMAKYYSSHPPKYSMVFIGFSGEEIGMLGSKAFVENPLFDLRKIKFLTNFDMAGTGEEGIRVVNGTIYKNQYDRLVELNNKYQLVPKVDIRGESCNSDHCAFYQKGVPAIFIYTQGGIRAYHDIYDRYETLPFTEFEDYFKLMTKFFDSL
ncbi:M28 family peptidase [Pedobacter sp. MC2016-14]|uniref:M28 family metallopeptidase n=1 Tax=Pedobacter sp. MC2016-14 TaxID=2897327 RepID=UPI001E57EE0E|nr:M28 family peptidase [Pedobacter sp. MC2016-14]MCD0486682.1 M28 family peptidase [Pedobacter sp. MC2016-14]